MSHKGHRDCARSAAMADLYRDGKTLQEIGDLYGVTRERVRQLIKKLGVSKHDGGIHLRGKLHAQRRPDLFGPQSEDSTMQSARPN